MVINEKPLPPRILTALTLAASGSKWAEAAEAVGIKAPTLRRYAKDPRATEFIERVVRENLNNANGILANAAPRLAEELVAIALDPAVKAYARTSAIAECFKILNQNVLEAEQRKQLQAIRNQLQSIEDGVEHAQVIDV
jgi:DNA-binding transcriptional MerR regulator